MTGRINLLVMKKVIGLVLLLIVLVAVSGCTQQTKTVPATTVAPTEVVTTAETVVETIAETPVETTAEATPEITAESTTIPATTVPATPVTAAVTMTPSTKITTVHIVNNSFSPSILMILPGTGITWINDDSAIHSVKATGSSKGKFNSGDIPKGVQFGYTFGESEGTFEYADGYNPNVTGMIIVKKGESFYGQGAPVTYMTSNATW
jgi:plastocyanin